MDIGWPEILIIAVVILVLFGSKKMPDAARSLGRSLRILKTEVKGLHDDEPAEAAAAQQPAGPTPLPAGQSRADVVPPAGPASTPTGAGERSDTP
ncbi:MAG: Sec-independent protein translocase subunit TatA [Frankiales bacterium]|nr:Sec-independent protein translocase subunit TatA [Frankiales bacterium]